MVIVKLFGGLGNQLFQYAAGRSVAHRHGLQLQLDISWFAGQSLRTWGLAPFQITGDMLPAEQVKQLNAPLVRRWPGRTWFRFAQRISRGNRPLYLIERKKGFDRRMLDAPSHVFLVGYWQSEKYFDSIAGLIRSELTFRNPGAGVNREMEMRIFDANSVSVHVRRGDFVSTPGVRDVHALCGVDYYQRASSFLRDELGTLEFFVFSDDVQWARANIKLPGPTTFVLHNGAEIPHEDLRLMMACQHHILANSTFGWWGAWLARYSGKRIIAPRRWFRKPELENPDLLPNSWRRI